MSENEASGRKPGILDRILRIVGDVRPGEGGTALVLATTVFLLLGAYYLLKVAREALLLAEFEAETKVYASAGQAVLLIPAVYAFGWLSTRVDRVRLVTVGTLFFASHLGIFAALHAASVPIGIAFFVWVGVFNMFVIAQFWAFTNDLYTEEEGRRLFAVVGLGSSLGAIAGSYGADPVGDAVGTLGLLLLPAGLLLLTLIGVRYANARVGGIHKEKEKAKEKEKEKDHGHGAFRLLISDRYLVLIAVLMVLLNWVNTTGEYVLDRVMQDQLREAITAAGDAARMEELLEGQIREFKSEYFFWFNTIGFLLQLLVVGRLMKYGGAGLAIMILPIVALLGQAAMFLSGAALLVVMGAKIAENSVDYSINNTGRNALFLVTPKHIKYKVKVLVDSVLVRGGDVLAGAAVLVGTQVIELPPIAFIGINTAVTVLWIFVVVALAREHRRRAGDAKPDEKPAAA